MKIFHNIARWYGRFFAHPILIPFNKFLVHLGMRGLGVHNFGDFFVSGELHFLNNYLLNIKQPIVFDIGANTGSYAILCQKINSNAKIFCFEPHPKNFAILEKKVNDNNQIYPINLALSNSSSSVDLYDYADNLNSRHASLYQDVIETVKKEASIKFEIKTSTIDEIITKYKIEKIHLIKIDVEGHDLRVIQGAEQALEKNIINAIQFEFTKNKSTVRVFMKDFFDLLAEKFLLYRLLPYGLLPLGTYNPSSHEIFAYQNIVCLLKNPNS